MKTYILVGSEAVRLLDEMDWQELEQSILYDFNGDIVTWNKDTDDVSELLEMLNGWDDFRESSEKELETISLNTEIEIFLESI